MELKTYGIVARSTDFNEYDKKLRLITPLGIIFATIKGVKKPKSKLKPASIPFAFYQYNLVKKGSAYIISSADQIEDLFSITTDEKKFQASSILLEISLNCFIGDCQEQFIQLLHCIKDIIYCNQNPYLYAIKFIQYIIHSSGYALEYERYQEIDTPLKLLSYIHYNKDITKQIDDKLIILTLNKIINVFEKKFECVINSKSNLFT